MADVGDIAPPLGMPSTLLSWLGYPTCCRSSTGDDNEIKTGKSEPVDPFQLSIIDLAQLNVAGREVENAEQLEVGAPPGRIVRNLQLSQAPNFS